MLKTVSFEFLSQINWLARQKQGQRKEGLKLLSVWLLYQKKTMDSVNTGWGYVSKMDGVSMSMYKKQNINYKGL